MSERPRFRLGAMFGALAAMFSSSSVPPSVAPGAPAPPGGKSTGGSVGRSRHRQHNRHWHQQCYDVQQAAARGRNLYGISIRRFIACGDDEKKRAELLEHYRRLRSSPGSQASYNLRRANARHERQLEALTATPRKAA